MFDFGSASNPLRPSRLGYLVLCHWRGLAKALDMLQDESGKAAGTGSAVHFAVAAFHRGEVDPVARMRAVSATFPLADMVEAERIFGRYVADPRNHNAEVVRIEFPIRLELDPKYLDGPPIVIEGTLDQIRRVDGFDEVWDVKTGDRTPLYMQNVHALQLAAYAMGAGVRPGGYIRTKGYFTRGAALPDPAGVFVPAGIADPDKLLDAVRWAVCAIRSGQIVATPGDHCSTCDFAGNEYCVPKLQQHLTLMRAA